MKPFAATLATSVATLQADGAHTIVVLNLNEYARLVDANGSLGDAGTTQFAESQTYGAAIWSALTAAGVNFVPADISSLFTYVSQNPTKFGFTGATVLASNPACGSTSSLVCGPGQLVAANAEQTHLWADDVHLTTAGQTIEVDYIKSLLTAPSQIPCWRRAPYRLAWRAPPPSSSSSICPGNIADRTASTSGQAPGPAP
jgi:outer membrane lipase/esterase